MRKIKVPGFQFAGVACGIKKSGKKDLALIVADKPATAAALFTSNQVKSPAVLVGMERMRATKIRAVVVNSGNANACTGARGLSDAREMCREAGAMLSIDPNLVIPSSTGIIGIPLPMDKVARGIEKAAAHLSADGFSAAAEAIMTTDRFVKVASARCSVGGKPVRIAGMVKGAGMIAPHMATMLAYILTDAAVDARSLRYVVRAAAEETFNSVTVDGDRSTNDTVLLLASGRAGNSLIKRNSRGEKILLQSVRRVMKELALKLVEDGEGATKVVEIRVEGARSTTDAKKIAFKVANSQLVKTAFYGQDPNFGRIMVAVGCAGVPLNAARVDVLFDKVVVVKGGVGQPVRERAAARVLRRSSFPVKIRLHQGRKKASVWTSDLGHDYVRINSAYRT